MAEDNAWRLPDEYPSRREKQDPPEDDDDSDEEAAEERARMPKPRARLMTQPQRPPDDDRQLTPVEEPERPPRRRRSRPRETPPQTPEEEEPEREPRRRRSRPRETPPPTPEETPTIPTAPPPPPEPKKLQKPKMTGRKPPKMVSNTTQTTPPLREVYFDEYSPTPPPIRGGDSRERRRPRTPTPALSEPFGSEVSDRSSEISIPFAYTGSITEAPTVELPLICVSCRRNVRSRPHRRCVYDHIICNECVGWDDLMLTLRDDKQLLANDCFVCQKLEIDEEYNVRGYPPRFDKFFLARKLLGGEPPLCDVAATHRLGDINAKFVCIDCNAHACDECLLEHVNEANKAMHTVRNLLWTKYQPETLMCLDCKANKAVAFCRAGACMKALCRECSRRHEFHGLLMMSDKDAINQLAVYIRRMDDKVSGYNKILFAEQHKRKEIRKSKKHDTSDLVDMIRERAREYREMITKDEEELVAAVMKHREQALHQYNTIDDVLRKKSMALKHLDIFIKKVHAKGMSNNKRKDLYAFLKENEKHIKNQKVLEYPMTIQGNLNDQVDVYFKPSEEIKNLKQEEGNLVGKLTFSSKAPEPEKTDRKPQCKGVTSLPAAHPEDTLPPKLGSIRYMDDLDKIAAVDENNHKIKILSRPTGDRLVSERGKVRVEIIRANLMNLGDEVMLEYNKNNKYLIVLNCTTSLVTIYDVVGNKIWNYELPSGAGRAMSVFHTDDGQLFVGRNHVSDHVAGGIVEIHIEVQRGKYTLLRKQGRFQLEQKPKLIGVTPSGYVVVHDGNNLHFFSKILKKVRPEDSDFKHWRGVEASDMFVEKTGHILLVDPNCGELGKCIIQIYEEGTLLNYPLQKDPWLLFPKYITGDNKGNFFVVDQGSETVKVFELQKD